MNIKNTIKTAVMPVAMVGYGVYFLAYATVKSVPIVIDDLNQKICNTIAK